MNIESWNWSTFPAFNAKCSKEFTCVNDKQACAHVIDDYLDADHF